MNSSQLPNELSSLVGRFCDGELDDIGFALMCEKLRASAHNRQVYRRILALHSTLTWDIGPVQTLQVPAKFASPPAGGVAAVPSMVQLPTSRWINAATSPLRRPVWWSILACGVLFAAYFGIVSWGIFSKKLDDSRFAGGNTKPVIISASPAPVATITSSDDCQWQVLGEAVRLRPGTKLLAQNALNLISGTAEITFADGAMVVLEGPATFVVEQAGRAKLDLGKLVASVPLQAVGFTIATPTAEIIDLGTEFGVQVADEGTSEVHVLKGAVETRTLSAESSGLAAEIKPLRLHAGNAALISSTSVVPAPIKFETSKFQGLAKVLADRAAGDGFKPSSPALEGSLHAEATGEAAGSARSRKNYFKGPIPLGNLFDDWPNVTLEEAVATDTYAAYPEIGRLGVVRLMVGGADIQEIGLHTRFDLTSVGWTKDYFKWCANDAYIANEARPHEQPIRTLGHNRDLKPGKVEDGIGMHANGLITFDLDIIREAGKLQDVPLRFVCDRAGINDPRSEDRLGSVNMLVLLSNQQGVQRAILDGEPVSVACTSNVWHLRDRPTSYLKPKQFVSLDIPLPPNTRYLTLLVAEAVDGLTGDEAVWSGARLVVVEGTSSKEERLLESDATTE